MLNITGNHINKIFIELAKEFQTAPEITVRGLKTKELYNVFLTLTNPWNSVPTLKSRKLNKKYLDDEFKWYLSGNLDVTEIGKASKFWLKLANSNHTVNSNYGFLVFTETFNGKSQFEWCVDNFRKDKYTRKAVINYNQPRHKYMDNKDFVCTIMQQFMFRNNQLDCITVMRSNDFIYGLSYDLMWFTYVHLKLADLLKMRVGNYFHYVPSLHIYEKHWDMVKEISKEKENGS